MDRPNIYKLEIISYSIFLIICVGLLIWSLKLYNADLHAPFSFGGDALYTYALTKTTIENGWVWHNSALGAPYGLDNYDFPAFNFLDILIIKIISLFSSDAFFVENLFYLLTFPLTTFTSLIVFRQFNINYAYSALGSLLFTFVPYHILRLHLDHLNASSYYIIPLMVMVLLWIYCSELYLQNSNKTFSIKQLLSNRKMMASIFICILAGSCFKYYPYIFCIFLFIMGVLASVKSWRKTPFFVSAVLIISVVLVAIVNYMPVIIYDYQNGANFGVIARQPADSEIYGLKIIQLLLPIYGHRIPILSNFAEHYARTAPLINENASSSLGVIAGFGFIMLIAYIFFTSCGASIKLNGMVSDRLSTALNGLSLLNLSAILFATIGGFCSIVAYAVFPLFRSINRMSIFIAFFSIFAILILLQAVSEKFNKHDILICSIAFVLLAVGMLDQTSNFYVPKYSDLKEEHLLNEQFITNIESKMPKNAMIFQLPYMQFPESSSIYKMACNSHLRAYLHSSHLRWSYPTMKGRSGDAWQKLVASMPVQDMLKTLTQTGFEGIYIDSYGFEDGGAQILSNITQTLETKPLISDNGRLYFFDMTGYGKRIKANSSLNSATLITFHSGWHGIENISGTSYRWMQADGAITVYSPENRATNLSLRTASFYRNRTLEISMDGRGRLAAQFAVPTNFINLTVPMNLVKGENTMRLHVPEGCERACDMLEMNNSDARCLSIAIQNATIA